MPWWLWIIAGCALLVLELVGSGFFILFFGVGAFCLAFFVAVWPDLSLSVQLALYGGSSIGSLLLFRQRLTAAMAVSDRGTSKDVLRDTAIPLQDLAPGAVGNVEVRGVPWKARNASSIPLRQGQRCRVTDADNLPIQIVPE